MEVQTLSPSCVETQRLIMLLPPAWRDLDNELAGLVERARMDEGFKRSLVANPIPLLQEVGIGIPDGVEVRLVEDLDVPWKMEAAADAQRVIYSIHLPQ